MEFAVKIKGSENINKYMYFPRELKVVVKGESGLLKRSPTTWKKDAGNCKSEEESR